MQWLRSTEPCSSYTRLEPAAWCSPSMFWVTTASSLPSCSHWASLMWAALGLAFGNSILLR